MYLVFDTETTGFVNTKLSPAHPSQPHLVQLGALLLDRALNEVAEFGCIVRLPDGVSVPEGAANVHGITTAISRERGLPGAAVFGVFAAMCEQADTLVCHNKHFDMAVMEAFAARQAAKDPIFKARHRQLCTMLASTDVCKLPGRYPGTYKWPKLQELHKFLFNEEFADAHSALADVQATIRCLRALANRGHISLPTTAPKPAEELPCEVLS